MLSADKIKIPFKIGITGQCDDNILKTKAKDFFTNLRELMPYTPFSFICDGIQDETKSFLSEYGEISQDHELNNANILISIGNGSISKLMEWRNRLISQELPFASNLSGFTIHITQRGIYSTPRPEHVSKTIIPPLKQHYFQKYCSCFNGKQGQKNFRLLFSHRKMLDALRFIDKYNEQASKSAEHCDNVNHLLKRYEIADSFSYKSQSIYQKELNRLFVLSFGVGLMSQIYGGINHAYANQIPRIGGFHFTWIELTLPIYILLFLIMLGYYFIVKIGKSDKKYVEFRFLAEALRVQYYWYLGNVRENGKIALVSKYVIPTNIAQVECTSLALHNWDWDDRLQEQSSDDIVKKWVDGQVQYYKGAIKKREKRKNIWKWTAVIFYVISFILAISYFVFTVVEKSVQTTEGTYHFFHFFPWSLSDGMWLGIGPFIFAMIGYLIEKKGWEEEIESFKQSVKMFETIKNELNATDDTDRRNALLLILGREALKEHESWLKLHRNRKPEPNY